MGQDLPPSMHVSAPSRIPLTHNTELGCFVGLALGDVDGLIEGLALGERDGLALGERDGLLDGELVGT